MKYIRLFEQHNLDEEDRLDLLDFGNSYLAYLLDEGFYLWTNGFYDGFYGGYMELNICKPTFNFYDRRNDQGNLYDFNYVSYYKFRWSDIEDYFIPFMSEFNKHYTYSYITISGKSGNNRRFRYGSDILNRLLSNKFPLTDHKNPKIEMDIISLEIEDIKKIENTYNNS